MHKGPIREARKPLVTVCVASWNQGNLKLLDWDTVYGKKRSMPSANSAASRDRRRPDSTSTTGRFR
jgi:hypothetical protein